MIYLCSGVYSPSLCPSVRLGVALCVHDSAQTASHICTHLMLINCTIIVDVQHTFHFDFISDPGQGHKNFVFLHTLYKTGGTLCARLSMHVCMHVSIHVVRTSVRSYVCMRVVRPSVRPPARPPAHPSVCAYVCMYVCMYACRPSVHAYVCMHACM